jgi:MFS family permease
MDEDPWRRGFEYDQVSRQLDAQAHQKEREVLFANEAFLIGVLQVVSGGSLFAGLSQTQALERLAGSVSFLGFITLMAAALVASVLAAYWKHEYKKWDVKAAVSVAEGNHVEAKARARKTGTRLVAMRRAMLACVVVFIVGIGQLLAFAWMHALWPTTEKGSQTAASLTPSRAQPTNATAARPIGQRPAGAQELPQKPAPK